MNLKNTPTRKIGTKKTMEISKGIKIVDLALLIDNSLVIADTHIGYEEELNKRGVLIPRFQFKDVIQRLENIIGSRKFQRIIINGDIKHEFGRISEQEWRHALKLLDFLKRHCKEVILIRGNHDTILGPIADKRSVTLTEFFVIGDVLIIHGDKPSGRISKELSKKEIKTIIIGHEHPAVSLREGSHAEKFKCFLKGNWKSKTLIVQPSFNLVTEGTDVTKEKLLSPFLKNVSGFEVFIVEDSVYSFGKVSGLPK